MTISEYSAQNLAHRAIQAELQIQKPQNLEKLNRLLQDSQSLIEKMRFPPIENLHLKQLYQLCLLHPIHWNKQRCKILCLAQEIMERIRWTQQRIQSRAPSSEVLSYPLPDTRLLVPEVPPCCFNVMPYYEIAWNRREAYFRENYESESIPVEQRIQLARELIAQGETLRRKLCLPDGLDPFIFKCKDFGLIPPTWDETSLKIDKLYTHITKVMNWAKDVKTSLETPSRPVSTLRQRKPHSQAPKT